MTPNENKILGAQQGKLVKAMKSREVLIIVRVWIPDMCRYAGRKVNDEELNELASDLTADIYDDFKHYTMNEAKLYLEMGLKHEFGHYKWFTGSLAYSWLKAGLQLHSNVKRMSQPRDYEKIDYSDPATQKEYYDYLVDTVEKFKVIPFGWNYCPVYHYMVREGLLKLSKQEIKDIEQRVRMNRLSHVQIKMMEDSKQFEVLFRMQAVKEWLMKTYNVKPYDFKLKKVEGNIVRL